MRVIVAGSRSITSSKVVITAMAMSCFTFDEIVSGTAKGVDSIGEKIAYALEIPVTTFPANWKLYGKAAGYHRNEQMAQYADALLAIWDGESKGTKHMINLALKYDLDVCVYSPLNEDKIEEAKNKRRSKKRAKVA